MWYFSPALFLFADTTVSQEGGLQDVAIEVIHLLLAHLVKGKDQFGIGADQKEAFLQTLRKGKPIQHLESMITLVISNYCLR